MKLVNHKNVSITSILVAITHKLDFRPEYTRIQRSDEIINFAYIFAAERIKSCSIFDVSIGTGHHFSNGKLLLYHSLSAQSA